MANGKTNSYTVYIDNDRADEFQKLASETFGDAIEIDYLDTTEY
jgi:hypothetical protein